MRIAFCILFCLLAAPHANSAALYKCTGPQKAAISIQSAPCPAGSKQIWVRDGTPDPPPTEQQVAAKNVKRQQDAEAAGSLSRMAGTTQRSDVVLYRNNTNVDYQKQRCDSAKRQALQIRERDWKTLTVDALRRLDAWVESECKKT